MPPAPDSPFEPGDRVTVVSKDELLRQQCHQPHYSAPQPLEGVVGVVVRISARAEDHPIVVEFPTILRPIFGEPWYDLFRASELVMVEPRYAFLNILRKDDPDRCPG